MVLTGVAAAVMSFMPVARSETNLLQAFVEANDLDCLHLTLEGICLWVVVGFSLLTGVKVNLEGTLELSHYNPELLVSASGRIDTELQKESQIVYGTIQKALAKPIIEVITGEPVPSVFDDTSIGMSVQGGGRAVSSTSRGRTTTLSFTEVTAIGAPGNIITLYDTNGEAFTNIISDVLEGVQESITSIGAAGDSAQSALNAINSTNTNFALPELVETTTGDSRGWGDTGFRPIDTAKLFLDADLVDDIETIAGLYSNLSAANFDVTQAIENEIEGAAEQAQNAINDANAIGQAISDSLNTNSDDIDDAVSQTGIDNPGIVDNAGVDIDGAQETLTDALQEGVMDALFEGLTEGTQEYLDKFNEIMAQIDELTELVESAADLFEGGAGVKMHYFQGFCSRNAESVKPYFLSGLDIVGWRMGIPEVVYPKSYALYGPGLPTDLHVVNQQYATPNVWGGIYPRKGFVAQSDISKARSLAAFRAIHIVTRTGQPHIYKPLTHKGKRKWKYFDVARNLTLQPQDEESGLWQLIDGGKHSCEVMASRDDAAVFENPLKYADPNNITLQSHANRAPGDETRLLYQFWQKQDCCKDPASSSEHSTFITTIPLGIELL